MIPYTALISEMARRSITKRQIAQTIGICDKALYNKLRGIAPFTWDEVSTIRKAFFSDMTSDQLFATGD